MSQSRASQGLLGGPPPTVFQRSGRFPFVIRPYQSFSLVVTWMGKRRSMGNPHLLLIIVDQQWHVISYISIGGNALTCSQCNHKGCWEMSSCMHRERNGVVNLVLCLTHWEWAKHFLLLLGICLSSQVTSVLVYIIPGYVVWCIQLGD